MPVCFRLVFNMDLSKVMFDEYDRWQVDADKKQP